MHGRDITLGYFSMAVLTLNFEFDLSTVEILPDHDVQRMCKISLTT